MATENSPIRAPGVGKNSKRHDLDGTPGLSGSDLQYGDVQKMEQGQRMVQNTNKPPATGGQTSAPAAASAGQQASSMQVPDALPFALQKLGGGQVSPPTGPIQQLDTSQYLPLIRSIATSSGASPMLKAAYMRMLQEMQAQPIVSGGTALIDRQEYDRRVEEAF